VSSTRRGLIAGAALALVAARPARADVSEPAAVRALIRHEDAAAAAYALAAEATEDALLERIARQDAQHAHVLRVQYEALTIDAGHRPPDAERAVPAAARLAGERSRAGAVAAAIALERELRRAYVASGSALIDRRVLQTVATILGSHAQHMAVLREAAGRPMLDEAGVNGG